MLTYKVNVKKFQENDAEHLLKRGLRKADVLEAQRIGGLSPYDSLHISINNSTECISIFCNDVIIAIAGVGLVSHKKTTYGVPWLMGHEDVERQETALAVARWSKKHITRWLSEYGLLANVADPKHTKSLPYLAWLGFHFDWDTPIYGHSGDRLVIFFKKDVNLCATWL